ncbi:MAG TPA: hypothetical protein PKH69_04160 [Thiobacillaceae bacterium]|jgi:hypothetical protein|nr:hypothetical protein [Thiobacillaceae bacterium]HNU63601.1 hypothetical protein [Thiobacillaceae bacterium]
MGAIFLSASVPTRPPFDADSRPQEIQAAISALAQVALGRKKLVWGGHPAITPLLWAAAQSVGVEYAVAVELFQSRFFKDEDFPLENKHFANVTYVDPVPGDLTKSLHAMRLAMMTSTKFDAAVFIGGMEGVLDEYNMFAATWPNANCIPIAQTGGAAFRLALDIGYQPPSEVAPLDFVALFYRELNIRPRQKRELK